MATGTELFSLMTSCRDYFAQISALICDVDSTLAESGFPVPKQFANLACFLLNGNPRQPTHWGPRYLVRAYARSEWNDDYNHAFWGFFCIYPNPDEFTEPVAAWGTAEPKDVGEYRNKTMKVLGIISKPRFLKELKYEQWVRSPFAPDVGRVCYRACPLVALSSPDVVEKLVIQPLRERLVELNRLHP
ncbi:MAG: hypothetical protein ABSH32_23695 [Bryobacteraceae bacterium]|jgi:hypothetical protein